jgi:hypothetical protein
MVRCCNNCVYVCIDPEEWLRDMWRGVWPAPQCANHPWFPGRMQAVSGIACRNYRPKPAPPKGDVRLIPLTDGFYAYVDAADYERLSGFTWWSASGYAARTEQGRTIFMHREIMQPPRGMIVDHADGNRANNARANLRVCTRSENQCNTSKKGCCLSRFKGVSYDKRHRKWYACCQVEGVYRWLGYFEDEVEAARTYDRKAVEQFGEFARLNFAEEWPAERRRQVQAEYRAGRDDRQVNA